MTTLGYEFLKAQLRGAGDQREDSHLNSPLYYMLTGRRGAWLYQNKSSTLITCAHPHIDNRIMIFPELGRADYSLTASVIDMMQPPENGVQLARHTEDEVSQLKMQIATQSQSAVAGVSVVEETVMDWRYPVHVLDAEVVANMEGSTFSKIRTKFRKAASSVECVPLEKEQKLQKMRAALKFWEGNMIFNNKDTKDMSDIYDELFKIVSASPNCANGLLFMQGRRPVGLSMWDEPYMNTANFLVNLSDISVNGLSEFQFISTCQALREQGVSEVNVGGSELHSLDSFKAKFQPAKTLKLHSAEVVYRGAMNTDIKVHEVVPMQTSSPQALY